MEEVELGKLTDRKIGYGIVQPGASVPNGVPVIKVNNIISGLRCINDLENTSFENDAKYKRTKLSGGELLISVVGTIGKTIIVPKSFAGCNLVRATCLIDIKDELDKPFTQQDRIRELQKEKARIDSELDLDKQENARSVEQENEEDLER